ncbi:MAG: DEAD/DEAH box helicase family protein [Christensenellaceae bacterium]|jgi:type III restriction enzyme|nr:DEAD/DEAH box helicase family protein [Christensenellaceae bacterium]
MIINLKDFQLEAVNNLLYNAEKPEKEVILQSPTGSGKTVILTSFINEFASRNGCFAFVWLSIGKGDLAEQSRDKMNKYFPLSKTGNLADVLTGGFTENSVTFINWEKITKKGNIAISDSERDNLQDKIEKALLTGLKFILIIDEQHLNDTFKATEIKRLFNPICEIYASATPKNTRGKTLIKIEESTVIGAGLIKKKIIVNEGFANGFVIDEQNANTFDLLLDLALAKEKAIFDEFQKLGVKVNPLICVQLPNNSKDDPSSALIVALEKYFASNNITVDNGTLAFWLSGRYDNLSHIEDNNAQPVALIFKQAIATGWDCPRAHILVKLRENMDETFEVQTIGRIRRMPEVKHYDIDLIDNCYIYTFDKGFIEGLSKDIYGGLLKNIFMKTTYTKVTLKKEYNPDVQNPIDPTLVREVIADYYNTGYGTKPKRYKANETLLTASGYTFDPNIVISTVSGGASTFRQLENVGTITGAAITNTHIHGRDFHKAVGEIGSSVSLKYEDAIKIVRALFVDLSATIKFKKNLFDFKASKLLYAFIINNKNKIKDDFGKAMTSQSWQRTLQASINVDDWTMPKEYEMPIDDNIKRFVAYNKNVYEGYLSCVAQRSDPEKRFEKWCEESKAVVWFYKNGEHNQRFFSIIYINNFGKQKAFYPDYILQDGTGKIWILETKGGQTSGGVSQDIDDSSPQKFVYLTNYANSHKTTTYDGKTYPIGVGFVRFDNGSQTLLINTTAYDENLDNTKVWFNIDEMIRFL